MGKAANNHGKMPTPKTSGGKTKSPPMAHPVSPMPTPKGRGDTRKPPTPKTRGD